MKSRISQLVAVLAIAAVTVALFAGSALADTEAPADGSQAIPGFGQAFGGMMDGMDQATWGEMIQHMNAIHGPELTGKMIQWMNQGGSHCTEGGGQASMMGWGFNRFNRAGSMMGGAAGQ
jgi:hypothetical protein